MNENTGSIEGSDNFIELLGMIERNLRSVQEFQLQIDAYTKGIKNHYLVNKVKGVSTDLITNSTKIIYDMLSKITSIQNNFLPVLNEIFSNIKEFNSDYENELIKLAEIPAEPLQRMSIESLNKNADIFYASFKTSLNNYL